MLSPSYLGDAVYVQDLGNGDIQLGLNDPRRMDNPIVLERAVLQNLLDYLERMRLEQLGLHKAIDATMMGIHFHPAMHGKIDAATGKDIHAMLTTLAETAFRIANATGLLRQAKEGALK